MRKRIFRVTLLIALSIIWVRWPAAADQQTQPSPEQIATVKVFRVRHGLLTRERAMGLLTFRGVRYPVKFRGLSPRYFRRPLSLSIYNVARIEDLDGTFKPADESTCCVLRNESGAEIRFVNALEGDIRLDSRGVTVSIASEQVPSVNTPHGRLPSRLPESAGIGSVSIGPILVTPTLNAQVVGFAEANNGWGGRFNGPVRDSQFFFEQSNEEGLNASMSLGRYGVLAGRVSGIYSMTGGGLDAGATNFPDEHPWDYALESGYLEWSSGPLFPELGYDAITISGGPQDFTIGDGFLFTRGATNGGTRGASWLNPRTAFRQAGVIGVYTHDISFQGFFLEGNDNPNSHTRLAGADIETPIGEYATMGFTYCNIFNSDHANENGMNVFYWRGNATPIPPLPDLHLSSSFAIETNGNTVSGATGWYISPYYRFTQFPWKPKVFYRYASFSGGGTNGNQNFDPLFYGSSDWGTWYQGEILGNWITTNSNLISHQLRAEVYPTEHVTMDLILYKFLLYSRAQTIVDKPVHPVTSKDLADEVDLIFEYAPTAWWLVAVTVSAAIPNQAATQITGGTQTWVQSMLTTSFTF